MSTVAWFSRIDVDDGPNTVIPDSDWCCIHMTEQATTESAKRPPSGWATTEQPPCAPPLGDCSANLLGSSNEFPACNYVRWFPIVVCFDNDHYHIFYFFLIIQCTNSCDNYLSVSADGTKQIWTPLAKPHHQIGEIISCYHDPSDVSQIALRQKLESETVSSWVHCHDRQ